MILISFHTQAQEYTRFNFQALTDALLPSPPQHSYGSMYTISDMGVHEYLIYALDHYISIQQSLDQTTIPLSYPTAMMLDTAATQLVNAQQIQPSGQNPFPGGGMFASLSRTDRIRTLFALESLQLDMYLFPSPYQNNAGLVKYVTDALNRLAMFGYYSEWPAYGSTRLYPPDHRRLEFFPWGWQQVGYPGVSLGYRDFRGFLLKMERVEG